MFRRTDESVSKIPYLKSDLSLLRIANPTRADLKDRPGPRPSGTTGDLAGLRRRRTAAASRSRAGGLMKARALLAALAWARIGGRERALRLAHRPLVAAFSAGSQRRRGHHHRDRCCAWRASMLKCCGAAKEPPGADATGRSRTPWQRRPAAGSGGRLFVWSVGRRYEPRGLRDSLRTLLSPDRQ